MKRKEAPASIQFLLDNEEAVKADFRLLAASPSPKLEGIVAKLVGMPGLSRRDVPEWRLEALARELETGEDVVNAAGRLAAWVLDAAESSDDANRLVQELTEYGFLREPISDNLVRFVHASCAVEARAQAEAQDKIAAVMPYFTFVEVACDLRVVPVANHDPVASPVAIVRVYTDEPNASFTFQGDVSALRHLASALNDAASALGQFPPVAADGDDDAPPAS